MLFKKSISMDPILVTGINGFLGSHLSDYFINTGVKVYGISHGIYKSSGVKIIDNDIRGTAKYIAYVKFLIGIFLFPPPNNFGFTDLEISPAYETKFATTNAAA